MDGAITIGDPPIDIRLRVNTRARRLILRIARDGPVLTVPKGVRKAAAQDFLKKNEAWLRERLNAVPQSTRIGVDATFPFEGRALRVIAGEGPVRLTGEGLVVGGEPERVPSKVAGFLKTYARERLMARSEIHARALGRSFAKITLRDPKSRWGSCSSTGNLMYSWRLVMAPPQVLDYVAAHEVAHLVEFNHSRFFWRLVDDLCPDYPYHRKWLKEDGPHLHSYRFAP